MRCFQSGKTMADKFKYIPKVMYKIYTSIEV